MGMTVFSGVVDVTGIRQIGGSRSQPARVLSRRRICGRHIVELMWGITRWWWGRLWEAVVIAVVNAARFSSSGAFEPAIWYVKVANTRDGVKGRETV
jgi:hypothetical protein